MNKTFKGVIKQWCVSVNRVFGECIYHTEDNKPSSIRTSEIISITPIAGTQAMRLETENSYYVLI